jgi:hypothetical protein
MGSARSIAEYQGRRINTEQHFHGHTLTLHIIIEAVSTTREDYLVFLVQHVVHSAVATSR